MKKKSYVVCELRSPDQQNGEVLQSIAELYCEIWKEAPWYEDFWKTEKVCDDVRRMLKIDGAKCYFALRGREVIGFTWGYLVNEDDLAKIAGHKKLNRLFIKEDKLFYIDEMAVGSNWRQEKVAYRMSLALLSSLKLDQSIVLRTDISALAARRLYHKLGFIDTLIKDAKHQNRSYCYK